MSATLRIAGTGVAAVALAAGIALSSPAALSAQGGEGFLFKEPTVSLKFETGYGFQRAHGPLYDQWMRDFTLDRRDFDGPYVGGEIAFRVEPQWDVGVSVGYQSASTLSESLPYYGTDGLPIEQVTDITLVPVVAMARYFLRPRGRRIGRFAWIPERVVPYVGGGLGVLAYRIRQEGEFVDESTLDIFNDRLTSDRSTFLARALAGVNLSVGQQFVVNGEARYHFARGSLDNDFSGNIDLDGLQLVAGISVRF